MTEPRIYVASLADYNAGILHGLWIDLPADEDDVWKQIHAMLAASPAAKAEGREAEEFAVHDYEGFGEYRVSEWSSIKELVEMAEAIEEHGAAFAAYYDNAASGVSLEDAVEKFQDAYLGEWDSFTQYVEETIVPELTSSWPEEAQLYFDVESYARDLEGFYTLEAPTGVWVFRNV